ncbi:MAG TPA: M1 family metallopeptidase [Actinoplanes sp.]|nr:M1 family metallopeptidase [Actinoplanes sp.]
MRRAGCLVAVLLLGACSAGHPAPAAAPAYRPGAAGAGDPYFPTYGNGGYDVSGYDLNVRYDPAAGKLTGTARITATATQDLSQFNLDLVHLAATKVAVDGAVATSRADGNELVIAPKSGLRRGKAFTVVVDYGGTPGQLSNKTLGDGGWLSAGAKGALALGQPESASTWFPVNDHPSDKATFSLAITVPDGLTALSIGVPGPRTSAAGWTTWRWTESSPLASYLSTVVIGKYRVTTTTHDGKPMVTAVPASLPADGPAATSMARTGEIADFLATKFGPYPFDSYGGIVIDDTRIRYALETQSRPTYGQGFFDGGPNPTVVAHELAHQWFGDSVALERWQDIWLNEGFATYAEWLWQEHEGTESVKQSFERTYAGFDWSQTPGNPGVAHLFGGAVYDRGGMTVYALRRKIGDQAFDKLLTTWTSAHRDGNVNTGDLISLAEKISGQDLGAFFQAWLYGQKAPTY